MILQMNIRSHGNANELDLYVVLQLTPSVKLNQETQSDALSG